MSLSVLAQQSTPGEEHGHAHSSIPESLPPSNNHLMSVSHTGLCDKDFFDLLKDNWL
tara:strand:+ start:337 stop:507 length:171 start_codon:yes stop_codon:yes gene_type:complete